MPDTVPCPVALNVQVEDNPLNPPAGTAIEKVIDAPDTLPETVPLPLVPVLLSVSDSVPENDAPDCDNCHVIRPGPDESEAEPDHDPATLALVAGVLGLVGAGELPPPLPPHAAAPSVRNRSTGKNS